VAADGVHPVISGAIPITGWKPYDEQKHIYVADTPKGLDSRQLWVNDQLAQRTSVEIKRSDVSFTPQGMVLNDPRYDYLAGLPDQDRMEVVSDGFFTRRVSPVESVQGRTLTMKQPAWNNNIWGYDTITRPFGPEFAHLFLANSRAFLSRPGQWVLHPKQGKLYLRPPDNVSIDHLDVELPASAFLSPSATASMNRCGSWNFKAFDSHTPPGSDRRAAKATPASRADRI